MATRKSTRKTRPAASKRRPATVPALQRRVAELEAELEAARRRHARQVAGVRREADRRLADMVQEIAQLRHYQAREEALTRLLTEREAQLAVLQQRAGVPDTSPGEASHALT